MTKSVLEFFAGKSFSSFLLDKRQKSGEKDSKVFSAPYTHKGMIWKVKFANYFEGLWLFVSKLFDLEAI